MNRASPEFSTIADRLVPFPSYEDFQGTRVFPMVAKVAWLGAFFLAGYFYLDWKETGGEGVFGILVFLRSLAIALTLVTGFAAAYGPTVRVKFWVGLGAGFLCQTVTTGIYIFILPRVEYLPYVMTFFFLSFLLQASLVSGGLMAGFFVTVTVSLLVQFGVGSKGPEWYSFIGHYLVPCLAFMAILIFTIRNSARETYLLARRDHSHLNLDPLSTVLNRASWLRRAESRWGRSMETRIPGSLLMVDIDHFKAVNDTLGHDAGDRVIQAVAEVLLDQTREDDLVGRLGGEEFAVFLPGADLSVALTVAERIRAGVEAADPPGGRKVTVSLGAVETGPEYPLFADLVKESDRRLYAAKADGRNRVVGTQVREPALE